MDKEENTNENISMEDRFKNFRELKQFFLDMNHDDFLVESNNHSFISLDWVFAKKIDRLVIEKAILNIMQGILPYANLEHVDGFELIRNKGRLAFQAHISGSLVNRFGDVENKTFKLEFTDDQSLIDEMKKRKDNGERVFVPLHFEQLGNEIIGVASSHTIKIEKDDMEEESSTKKPPKKTLVQVRESTRVTKLAFDLMQPTIFEEFDKACGNLLDYYKYLLEKKNEFSVRSAIITQRTDDGGHKMKSNNSSFQKLSDSIDFAKREQFLERLGPEAKITIELANKKKEVLDSEAENTTGEEDKKKEVFDSYSVYMYHNNLLQSVSDGHEGYLFVAEPISSERETRLFYLSSEEFENFKTKEEEDKITQIAMHFLEMSPREFSNERKGTMTMKHTVLDTFEERVLFYKDGTKAKSITATKTYKGYLDKLYNEDIDLPYYKPKTVIDIGYISSTASTIDNTLESFTHSFGDQKKAPSYTAK